MHNLIATHASVFFPAWGYHVNALGAPKFYRFRTRESGRNYSYASSDNPQYG